MVQKQEKDQKNSLSVALAVYNEESQLAACLSSVSWADEIVVVDGGSTDRTVSIAKKYGAKIIETTNPVIFHINKQKAIDACKGAWILQLDADEVVPPELKKEIESRIRNQESREMNGFWIPRKNYFLGRFLTKGGQYPDYTLRLYKNGKGKLPCKSVHEQAVVEGETGYLTEALLHYSYPDFSHYLEHYNRYTDIFAEELEAEGVGTGFSSFFSYMIVKPKLWFLSTYFRHKGFMDGFPGFVFSLFSASRYIVSYIKYWEKKTAKKSPHL